jgi:hypothetical protein
MKPDRSGFQAPTGMTNVALVLLQQSEGVTLSCRFR